MTRFGQAARIALYGRIDKVAEGEWDVYSMTSSGKYIVKEDGSCTCPDFKFRGGQCKHALGVELRFSVVQEVKA